MFDPSYLIAVEKSYLEPEEKLALAVVLDWFYSMLRLLRKVRRGKGLSWKEEKMWRSYIAWPYTSNARFWVEEVLGGSLEALRCLSQDFENLKKGENPKWFPQLVEVVDVAKKPEN